MASAREVKKRIRSVKNVGQITKALEAVSASRVRKAQARVLASRAFAEKAWEILLNVQSSGTKGVPLHPLLTPRTTVKNVMIILVTSDRGLAGAFNTNIIRVARRFADRIHADNLKFVTVGRKGRDTLVRMRENVIAEFSNPAEPTIAHVNPIVRLAVDEFLSGAVDEVFVAYTDFINTLTQKPRVLRLLPLMPYETDDQVAAEFIKDAPAVTTGSLQYEYEPGAGAILEEIVPRFTSLQLYQALLESQASEHSARMVAMRNASDNAGALIESLTLVYNKARQAGITAEILDIVGGAEALQDTLEKAAKQIEKHATYVPAEEVRAQAKSKPSKAAAKGGDDLTRIEGIGPKMSAALIAAGIDTFAKLAQSREGELRAAIEAAGMKFAPSMGTWAQQAEFAAKGDWAGLDTMKTELVSGRKG